MIIMRKNILTILVFILLINYVTAQSWSPVGSGIVPGPDYYRSVRSIATCNGELYAGGYFDSAGNIPTKNIAKWNGNNWSAVNQGIDGIVNALTVYNGQLFAGGNFSTAGSIAANDIAMWNGTNWSNVGNIEAYYSVKAMVVYNDELYAGGWFLNPGPDGTPIVRWNGTNWTSAGLEDSLYMISIDCMTVYNGELYVAGAYYAIGGGGVPEYYRIIKWNGIAWNNLATIPGIYTLDGALGNIMSMTVYNGELFIAGTFSIMIDTITTAYQIAKWNGTNWSSVGSGINLEAYPICCDYGDGSSYSFVKSLAVYNGALYATGRFDSCGSIATNNIAKWNGTNWTNMNQGINGQGYALLGTDTCLFVGGWFNTVNGNNFLSAKSIAKWKDSCLSSPPTQPINIYGNTTICEGTTQTYYIDTITGTISYSWILPSGWSGNSNTSVINVIAGNNSGELKVMAINSCGNSVPKTISIAVNPLPIQLSNVYGNDVVCAGSNVSYSTDQALDTYYTWMLPSGWVGSSTSASINVTAGNETGEISVKANNSCGSSGFTSLPIRLDSIPSKPGDITGNVYVNAGQSQSYSINLVNGVLRYNWSLSVGGNIITGQTTSKIDVNWQTPGTYILSVNAANSCGISADQKLTIKVSAANIEDPYSLQLFPNPSSGEFLLKAKRVQDKEISIEILNMTGQIVFRSGKKQGANDYTQLINLDKMPQGIYAVKIMVDDKVYVRSVAINR